MRIEGESGTAFGLPLGFSGVHQSGQSGLDDLTLANVNRRSTAHHMTSDDGSRLPASLQLLDDPQRMFTQSNPHPPETQSEATFVSLMHLHVYNIMEDETERKLRSEVKPPVEWGGSFSPHVQLPLMIKVVMASASMPSDLLGFY